MATTFAKLMTADQFYDWAQRPENRDRYAELERGVIVEAPLAGKRHGFVCANVAGNLGGFARSSGIGYVCTNNSGLVVERGPDTVRGPDVMFFIDRQTIETMDRKYAVRPPVLAVEVLSPDDRMNRTMRRISEMLNAGVAMVWVVDPEARDVSVYRPGREPQLIEEGRELSGEDVLEGFRCSINELFALPGSGSAGNR